ncbi:MAG: hypothetical protein ACXAD7_05950 [Candidatus Kariarchaeaceae archaeon]|jgi:hypothetical protein
MQNIEAINRLEEEIRFSIRRTFDTSHKPPYQHSSGRRLFLSEVVEEGVQDGPIIGALAIVYAANAFMSVDRIVKESNSFKKRRRIIYYLDSRPGQIGSTLLLELLKIDDGQEFSKHKFVNKIDESYFQAETINISSGEINEALSRMFRKTMPGFFGIDGRSFVRRPFMLKMQELNVSNNRVSYNNYKREIDDQTNLLIHKLNKLPM